jgi:hypothetical protein
MVNNSENLDASLPIYHCTSCGGELTPYIPPNANASSSQADCQYKCAVCIRIQTLPNNNHNRRENHHEDVDYTVHVSGEVASEVEHVSKSLLKEIETSKSKKISRKRSPWISGSFYLAGVIIIGTLLLIIAMNVSIWVLPIVIIGTLLLASIIGAFQLRQDSSLSQKNFLSLMLMTFRQVPFINPKDKTPKKP